MLHRKELVSSCQVRKQLEERLLNFNYLHASYPRQTHSSQQQRTKELGQFTTHLTYSSVSVPNLQLNQVHQLVTQVRRMLWIRVKHSLLPSTSWQILLLNLKQRQFNHWILCLLAWVQVTQAKPVARVLTFSLSWTCKSNQPTLQQATHTKAHHWMTSAQWTSKVLPFWTVAIKQVRTSKRYLSMIPSLAWLSVPTKEGRLLYKLCLHRKLPTKSRLSLVLLSWTTARIANLKIACYRLAISSSS